MTGIGEAFVFGSWAARNAGEPSEPLRDVDVLVVGSTSLSAVRRACAEIERELHVEVNPVVIDQARWSAKKPDPFVAQVPSQPLVQIPLEQSS